MLAICFSESPNPTIEDNRNSVELVDDEISFTITDLSHNTRYYVKSYIDTGSNVIYSNELSFTTNSVRIIQEQNYS
tara:strand:- start:102 stop:329 length:228 start_codon:yes stop_codon:yes gene_type:complete